MCKLSLPITRLRRIPQDYMAVILFTLVALTLPLFLDDFFISLAVVTLFWAYLGNAWNIMGGYAGQFSFGHAMFYGIGAYTSTVLLVDFGVSPWIGMLGGAILAGLFGAAIGYLLFRFGIRGHFFALGTFAIAEMVRLLATELEFINTSIGIHIPLVRGDSWLRMQFEETIVNYFIVILLFFVIGQIITITIVRNKLGYYFQAIRENEEAAAALGVDSIRYKVLAVAISAALTAIGGSFFAQYFLFIDPTIVFGVAVSVQILLRPVLGGMGTIWGPFVGALFLTPLAELTRSLVRTPPSFLGFIEGRSGVDVMIFGALLIVVVLFMPDGIVGAGKRLWNKIRKPDETFAQPQATD
jgi:branched-chain amino acid transport system permease protein